MKRFFPLLICFFLVPVFAITAQEGAAPEPAEAITSEEAPLLPEISGGESTPENAAGIAGEETSAPDGSDTEPGAETETKDPGVSYLEMDINTSSLSELAVWCRELGLSEGGARNELVSRLRSHYKLPAPGSTAAEGEKVITIESAKTTEYFTLDVVDEEYARLKGDVIISLKEGNAVHRIRAWEILYNRTRNVMTASGKVEYVKEDGDTVETFRGESITVNLDNWASIFMDGVSERSNAGNMTAYRFAGTVISRNSEEVTVLTDADITNPANEEAYWSLHASKIWLLPGNDFAFLNAILKVGNIPVLYFPFFYYPSDEIVFHPVLGGRTREGTFLQTTTYILGRPKTSVTTENSITKIFGSGSENTEKKREGIFLRSTGEKRQNPSETRLSLLFDAYVNLGAYLGTEVLLPRKGPFGEFTLSAGLGFTRNIYLIGNANTPFPDYDGVSEWNKAKFFSLDVPFRYRFNMTGSVQIANGSVSWAFPYYSDPYVDRDFMRRSEVLDWLAMLREGASASEDDESNSSYLNSFEWRLVGSYNPRFPNLAPYVSQVSVSSISSSLLFSRRDSPSYTGPSVPPNPGRSFFFPNQFTMYSISASVSGTPFTTGNQPLAAPAADTEPAPGDLLLPDLPLSPWGGTETEEEAAAVTGDSYSLAPPSLGQTFTLPGAGGGPQFSFDYRFAPSTASQLQFRSTTTNWEEQDDIDWSEISTILSKFRGDGSLGFNLSHSGGGAYSASLRLTGTGSWEDYVYLNEDAEEFSTSGAPDDAKIKTARDRARNETYFTSSWDLSASVRPFYKSTIWSNTSLQYSLKGLLAKKTFDADPLADDPTWDWAFGEWNKDTIDTHQVSANVTANIMDHSQTLSFSAVLPPKDASVSGSATFRAWISETSLRSSIVEPWDKELRKFQPVYFTETLRFGTLGSFQQYLVYDPEQEEYTTLTSTLNLSKIGLTAAFSAVYSRPWEFNPSYQQGQVLWQQAQNENLTPRDFRLTYVKAFSKSELWNKRLSFSFNVNSSLTVDLQRYSNSRLSFGISAKVGIANFLDLTFSTNSENAVIYKYLQNLPFFDPPPTELYANSETNFFMDLFNSFRFDSNELRRSSGFKLKSMNIALVHHLGDWNAKLSVTMTPYRPAGSRTYEFNNEVSFLIQWVPIEEIKTEIDYSNEKISVK